jgi:hypothetical protein
MTLDEDDLFDSLKQSVGPEATEQVRRFIESVGEFGVEPDFKSAAVMLKVPDPNGKRPGASLLAFERSGRVYNPSYGRNQVKRWHWDEATAERIIGAYWRRLQAIDGRFSTDGMSNAHRTEFIPLADLRSKLGAIADAMKEAVDEVQREAERRG